MSLNEFVHYAYYLFRHFYWTGSLKRALACRQMLKWRGKVYNGSKIMQKLFPYVVDEYGNFYPTYSSTHPVFSLTENKVDDVRENDVFLDIGANIGIISIRVGKRVGKLVCVEPLWWPELRKNLLLNDIKAEILICGLGGGTTVNQGYDDREGEMQTNTLTQLKEMCGGRVDFLKTDCEGYEWFIKPEELEGIRRIEFEAHNWNPSDNDPYVLINWLYEHYDVVCNDAITYETVDYPKLVWQKDTSSNSYNLHCFPKEG